MVVVLTVRLPVVATQLMVKLAVAVCPAVTLTVWEGPPLTLQLLGAPLRVTLWLPGAKSVNVIIWFVPIA